MANCDHNQIQVATICADCGKQLGQASFDRAGLSQQELQAQQGSELPDREQMSLINANVAIPINLAAALNVLSDGSIAYANATQYAPITQSTGSSALPSI